MKHAYYCLFLICLLTSCGYKFQGNPTSSGPISISVPYITGDVEGQLNTAIVRKIAEDPRFDYHTSGGAMTLVIAVLNDKNDRIGYRYDRVPTTGKRRKNIVATENRRTLKVEVKLIDAYTDELVAGPAVITASADYDYVDSNSIVDLTFVPPHGRPQTVLDFSLGQLDSIEGAHDGAGTPVYHSLAQKIVDGLKNQGW